MEALWLLWVAAGYLSGSIPFALLIGKAHGIDIRTVGSGNVGATNVGRALGRKWGVLCLLLDLLKGLLPVALAGWSLGLLARQEMTAAEAWRWLAVAAAAVLGHVYPLWLRFRGGKGVATGLGVLLGIWPVLTLAGVAAVLTWVGVVRLFRYVSLASIIAAGLLPLYVLLIAPATGRSPASQWPFVVLTALLALLVILRHRTNLARLRAGTEPKIEARKKPQ